MKDSLTHRNTEMMDIKYSWQKYEKCKDDLMILRNTNRDTYRNKDYLDWRYVERPHSRNPIIVWAENNERVKIGSVSLIPHHFMFNNQIVEIGVIGDITVSKEWRRKGIAQQMFKYMSKIDELKDLTASFVLPNEDVAGSLTKANWHTITNIDRYVKVLNVENIIKILLKSILIAKVVSYPINLILRILSYEIYIHNSDYNGEEIIEFDERFDRLWEQAQIGGIVIGLRNRQYLNWRYANHPLINYQIYTLKRKTALCGYIIYHSYGDTCHIDDVFFLKNNQYPKYLLAYFLKYIKRTNPAKITMNINKNKYFNLKVSNFGFIKRSKSWRVMISVNDNRSDGLLVNGNNWYLTAGDKDT